MKCKNCEKYKPFSENNVLHGLCSMHDSFQPVMAEDECVYTTIKPLTCADCMHYVIHDTACMTAEADDPICVGFDDMLKYKFLDILFEWLKRGSYSRAQIEHFCEKFEESELYDFIRKHCASANSTAPETPSRSANIPLSARMGTED